MPRAIGAVHPHALRSADWTDHALRGGAVELGCGSEGEAEGGGGSLLFWHGSFPPTDAADASAAAANKCATRAVDGAGCAFDAVLASFAVDVVSSAADWMSAAAAAVRAGGVVSVAGPLHYHSEERVDDVVEGEERPGARCVAPSARRVLSPTRACGADALRRLRRASAHYSAVDLLHVMRAVGLRVACASVGEGDAVAGAARSCGEGGGWREYAAGGAGSLHAERFRQLLVVGVKE